MFTLIIKLCLYKWNFSSVGYQYTVIFTNKSTTVNNHLTFRGRKGEAMFFFKKKNCHQIYWKMK